MKGNTNRPFRIFAPPLKSIHETRSDISISARTSSSMKISRKPWQCKRPMWLTCCLLVRWSRLAESRKPEQRATRRGTYRRIFLRRNGTWITSSAINSWCYVDWSSPWVCRSLSALAEVICHRTQRQASNSPQTACWIAVDQRPGKQRSWDYDDGSKSSLAAGNNKTAFHLRSHAAQLPQREQRQDRCSRAHPGIDRNQLCHATQSKEGAEHRRNYNGKHWGAKTRMQTRECRVQVTILCHRERHA